MNIDGDINELLDPTYDAPTMDYPFWFEGLSGSLVDCGYGINNFAKKGTNSNFNLKDSSTYGGTKDKHTATMESYAANAAHGYFEYIPWKGKTSPFWEDRFLYWDVDTVNSASTYGKGVESQLYFSGRAFGLWTLCGASNDAKEKDEGTLGTPHGSAYVRGMATPIGAEDTLATDLFVNSGDQLCHNETGSISLTDKHYKDALFCNGQSSEAGSACDVVNGYSADRPGFPVNPHQVFYCKNSCGRLHETLPAGCEDPTKPCDNVCYTPDVVGDSEWGGSSDTDYKSCMNIGSSEVAFNALKHAQGAFFGSIVVGQIAGLLVCKTRWLSITTQGMRNNFMLFGIGTELVLVAWLAYCIPINRALGTRNIRLVHWFCAIPFALLIFTYDELRKGLMRASSPEKTDEGTGQVTREAGWLERNTAY